VAVKYWRGGAGAVTQIVRFTFSAYTSGVTYTLTVANQSVSFTADASTEDNVVDGLVAAISAAGLAEFSEFTASNATASGITLTANTAGVPFDVTGSATGGVTASKTTDQAATGPNFFNNADNWEGGSLPSSGDDLVFEDTSIDLSYEIDQETPYDSVTIHASYTGRIGLPSEAAGGYQEYRPQFLKIGDGDPFVLDIGQGNGSQSQLIKIDANAGVVTMNQYGSGNAVSGAFAVVLKNPDSGSVINVFAGQLEVDADISGNVTTLRLTPSGVGGDLSVMTTETVTIGAVTINGGQLEVRGDATSLDASENAEVTVSNASAIATVSVASGATVFWGSSGGIATQLNVYFQGVMDFSRSGNTKTVAAAKVYHGGVLTDSLSVITWTAGVELVGCRIEDVTLDLGRGKTLSVS